MYSVMLMAALAGGGSVPGCDDEQLERLRYIQYVNEMRYLNPIVYGFPPPVWFGPIPIVMGCVDDCVDEKATQKSTKNAAERVADKVDILAEKVEKMDC